MARTIIIAVAGGLALAAALIAVWSSIVQVDDSQPSGDRANAVYQRLPDDPLAQLNESQRSVVKQWLVAHPLYDLIRVYYCCADAVWLDRSNPYVAVGDFNIDGHVDIALLLQFKVQFEGGYAGPATLVVFNGPLSSAGVKPAFEKGPWMVSDGLFGGTQDGSASTLWVGPYESDNGYSLVPKGRTYELEYGGDGG